MSQDLQAVGRGVLGFMYHLSIKHGIRRFSNLNSHLQGAFPLPYLIAWGSSCTKMVQWVSDWAIYGNINLRNRSWKSNRLKGDTRTTQGIYPCSLWKTGVSYWDSFPHERRIWISKPHFMGFSSQIAMVFARGGPTTNQYSKRWCFRAPVGSIWKLLAARGGGIPRADHVFDARHIKNPQKGPQKHLTGTAADLSRMWDRKLLNVGKTTINHPPNHHASVV